MKNILFLGVLMLCLACGKEDRTTHDLLKHGVPLEIYGPDSIDVTKQSFGSIMENFTIKGDDLAIELNASNFETKDLEAVIATQRKLIEEERYFSKIVEEKENGFIYERKIDSTKTNYDFRLVKLIGDKEYIFQSSPIASYDLEKTKNLYNMMEGPKK